MSKVPKYVRLVSDEAGRVEVLMPDGTRIPGISAVRIDPILPGGLVTATIDVIVQLGGGDCEVKAGRTE